MPNSSPEPDFGPKTIISGGDPKRERLDNLVINIELTLTSIIQGVALYFLCDNSAQLLVHLRLDQLVYVLNALLLIFLFWSRSIGHTLTVIRWPLDFSHNFFYFTAAMVESVAFTHIADPGSWFALLALFSAIVWLIFVVDTRLIRRAGRRSAELSQELVDRLHRDQQQNIRWIVPLLFCFHLGAAATILCFPDLFIKGQLHVLLGVLQFCGLIGYLIYLLRFLARLASMIMPES
ncbi:MAG: hypothetical protein WB696_32275 [Chthoniobacterales bacterium]